MKLSVVGYGFDFPNQLTYEAYVECQKSEHLLVWGPHFKRIKSFFPNATLIDLNILYQNNREDIKNYFDILSSIIEKTLNNDFTTVMFYGHPYFGISITNHLLKISNRLGLTLKIFPGISSFDSIINHLNIDPLEYGSMIIDANRLALFNFALNNHLHLFIYQASSIGNTKTNYLNPSSENQLIFLYDSLIQYYSENHKIILIQTYTSLKHDACEIRLSSLMKNIDKITYSTTIYVPPNNSKPQINLQFYNKIK